MKASGGNKTSSKQPSASIERKRRNEGMSISSEMAIVAWRKGSNENDLTENGEIRHRNMKSENWRSVKYQLMARFSLVS